MRKVDTLLVWSESSTVAPGCKGRARLQLSTCCCCCSLGWLDQQVQPAVTSHCLPWVLNRWQVRRQEALSDTDQASNRSRKKVGTLKPGSCLFSSKIRKNTQNVQTFFFFFLAEALKTILGSPGYEKSKMMIPSVKYINEKCVLIFLSLLKHIP